MHILPLEIFPNLKYIYFYLFSKNSIVCKHENASISNYLKNPLKYVQYFSSYFKY